MKQKSGYLWNDDLLNESLKDVREKNKDTTDELMLEILKLKEKIEQIRIENKSGKIDFIKAIVRFEENLGDGLFEITINQNYTKERPIKGVKTTLKENSVKNVQFKKPLYEGFNDVENVGFLFVGQNLNTSILENILKKLTKQVKDFGALKEMRNVNNMTEDEVNDL